MRILGHNLLPFSVAQLTSGWAAVANQGILAQMFFFDSDMPEAGMFTNYTMDLRELLKQSVAATAVYLRPTQEGLLNMMDQQVGFKARSGSVYEDKSGATIHYPKIVQPISQLAGTDITTAYTTSALTGNRKLFGTALYPVHRYAGVPTDELAPFVRGLVTEVEFDQAVVINAFVGRSTSLTACSGTIAPVSDTGVVGTALAWSIAANQEGNVMATPTPSSKRFRITQAVTAQRLAVPATASDVSAIAAYKTLKWAMVVIHDTNYGALATGNYEPTYFAVSVGGINSGNMVELLAPSLGPGEFATVAQIRTSTEV